jgi:hypothetical protein
MEAMPTVCVFTRDEELRGWLVDELLLMTWLGVVEIDLVASLDGVAGADLAIVGLDALTRDELAQLHGRTRMIAIGTPPADLSPARVLDARLTSKELKRAIRDALG